MNKVLLATVAALALSASFASAQTPKCAAREAILGALADQYDEDLHGAGLTGESIISELFVNPETGTWTLLASNAAGMSCVISAGTNWISITPEAPGDDA